MSAATPASSSSSVPRGADRMSTAGATPDPWQECARIEYGGDTSYASAVRAQIVGSPEGNRSQVEARLLKALALTDRTEAGTAFLCQMLALVGSSAAVPMLAALLRNAKTTDPARYALEAIPGPEAAAALREALSAVSGPVKAGLIGSIATRGDASARTLLAEIKGASAEPAVVREAAARALEALAAKT